MKIDIKNILSDKKGKGERWLAEAVEENSAPVSESLEKDTSVEEPEKSEEIGDDEICDADETETADEADVQEPPATEGEEPLDCEAEESPEDEAAEDMAVSEDISESVEETVDEEEAEPAEETETSEGNEPEEDNELVEKADRKEFLKRYGWIGAMTAAFVLLMLATFAYTSLVPREVYATINDKEYKVVTKDYTIEEFLESENIHYCEEDYISKPITTYIYDGIEFKLKHATSFKVTADGKTNNFKSLKRTVGEALADCGVKVNDVDIVTPAAETAMGDDMNIVIQRVTSKQETVEEKVPFKTKKKDDSSINEGTSKVVTKGVEGVDKVTYEITYIDGKESSKKELSRTTVKKPVDEVVAKGTKINFNGKSYSKKLVVKAYAYTGGGRTAMGTRARVGEIAVDPKVIPLGKNVYIEGVGARRAEDTGGNIKGNTIDIYMNSESACRKWGVRYVTIYIE